MVGVDCWAKNAGLIAPIVEYRYAKKSPRSRCRCTGRRERSTLYCVVAQQPPRHYDGTRRGITASPARPT
jgi:hypothetical protein